MTRTEQKNQERKTVKMHHQSKYRKKKKNAITLAIILLCIISGAYNYVANDSDILPNNKGTIATEDINHTSNSNSGELNAENLSDKSIKEEIPPYTKSPYCDINGGVPEFSKDEIKMHAYEKLGDLDNLGRCTGTLACLGKEAMPQNGTERGSISEIHPTGWHSVKYSNISGGYLYNRCHLIGWQLTGNDAIARNLITGTRYMNVEGMEPFENEVAEYLRNMGNHVMYRVIPVFNGNDLLARGVHMEAYSVEDDGKGISFNVFCYNVQPGIKITYSDGSSKAE